MVEFIKELFCKIMDEFDGWTNVKIEQLERCLRLYLPVEFPPCPVCSGEIVFYEILEKSDNLWLDYMPDL